MTLTDNIKQTLTNSTTVISNNIKELCIEKINSTIDINLDKYSKIAISKLGTLGPVFEPLMENLKQLSKSKTNDLIHMFLPASSDSNKTLDGFDQKTNLVHKENIKDLGLPKPLSISSINPVMLGMAIMLVAIDNKINNIQKTSQDIMQYLELKDESQLESNLKNLNDILINYKYNFNDNLYKSSRLILAQQIYKESSDHTKFFYKQINSKVNEKDHSLHGDKKVNKKIEELLNLQNKYKLALHNLCYSKFIEVLLHGNYNYSYLENIIDGLEQECQIYITQCKDCADKIEKSSNTSIQSFTSKTLSDITKGTGKFLSKFNFSNKKLEQNLVFAGENLEKKRDDMVLSSAQRLMSDDQTFATKFIDNIRLLQTVYNEPTDIILDNENLYLKISNLN